MKANLSKYDLLNVIMVCLDKDSEDVQSMNKDILKLLRVLLSGVVDSDKKKVVLNEDFDIEMTVEMERKMRDMCNLSAGIREDALRQGVEQGLRQGVEQGLKQGVEQGAERNLLENLRKLMQKLKITFEEAADMLDLSESDKKKYAKII
jgi:flagellar biosynthesis/type III secretory pathway protein FliH